MGTRWVPSQFAIAIRAGRLLRGLSLRAVEKGSGVPTWRLSSIEKGVTKPAPEEFATVWGFLSSDPSRAEPEATAGESTGTTWGRPNPHHGGEGDRANG